MTYFIWLTSVTQAHDVFYLTHVIHTGPWRIWSDSPRSHSAAAYFVSTQSQVNWPLYDGSSVHLPPCWHGELAHPEGHTCCTPAINKTNLAPEPLRCIRFPNGMTGRVCQRLVRTPLFNWQIQKDRKGPGNGLKIRWNYRNPRYPPPRQNHEHSDSRNILFGLVCSGLTPQQQP